MKWLKRLIVEIHRHSLWQIVAIYLGGAWLAYEIIQGIAEGRGLPAWLPALALILLVIGLPFVAWRRRSCTRRPQEPRRTPSPQGLKVGRTPLRRGLTLVVRPWVFVAS
jgi:hypothetical protein